MGQLVAAIQRHSLTIDMNNKNKYYLQQFLLLQTSIARIPTALNKGRETLAKQPDKQLFSELCKRAMKTLRSFYITDK
jgi:hypothetical protein